MQIDRRQLKRLVYSLQALTVVCIIMLSIILTGIIYIVKLKNKEPVIITETQVETQIVEKPVEYQSTIYYTVPLASDVQDVIFEECEKYNIPHSLIISIINQESKYDWTAIGDSGKSYGLMQIQKRYHEETMISLGCSDLLNPIDNVKTGISIIHTLLEKGKGVEWALMAYNGGESYANKKIKSGIVTSYATNILARAMELECERINLR
jgi:soluble lytic murein transglycosylase-like protein